MKIKNHSRISISDVAQAANCSIATVSLALNNKGRIAEKTKARILKVCKELAYVPDSTGRNLRLQHTSTIGLLFYPSCAKLFRNIFYAEVMEGLQESLAAAGYNLLLGNSVLPQQGNEFPAFLNRREVDGLVLLGAFPSTVVENLGQAGRPLLMLDTNSDDLPVDSVTTDGFSAGRMVVKHLAQWGHRRIVMMAYDLEDYNIETRIRGFQAGISESGLTSESRVIRNFISHDDGFKLLKNCLSGKNRPTALVTVNDTLAVAMVQRLKEAGYRLPHDLSVIGYDDDINCHEVVPRLTTVGVNKVHLGQAGAEVILGRLANPTSPVTKLRLPVTLIERASVQNPAV